MHGPVNVKAEMSGGICVSEATSPKTIYTECTFSYKRPPLTSVDQYMRYHSKQLEIYTGKSYRASPSGRAV
jgi:hypothetical protein